MESMKCPSCGSPNIVKINATEYKCENCKTSSKLSNDQTYLILINGYPCPSCGTNNENDVRFCGNCGNLLVKICISCGTETQNDKKFCPNCGKSEFGDPNNFTVIINLENIKGFKQKMEVINIVQTLSNFGNSKASNISFYSGILASHVSYDEYERVEQLGATIRIEYKTSELQTPSGTAKIKMTRSCILMLIIIVLLIFLAWIIVR
jgi:RNA polymerase subunit RPABC4/transcription elongation factor Spt4